jgi:S-adenosylmethionine-dependent methyltransferase
VNYDGKLPMTQQQDRNFDDLIDRFANRIYETDKGDWRLSLLKQDLYPWIGPGKPIAVWDAGCGFAQIGLWLAQQGHQLTLCDISEKMLDRARQHFSDAGLSAQFYHQPVQQLVGQLPDFELILFHAVLEWLVDPVQTLKQVMQKVKPGGSLSLLFYNRNAMVYSNVLKGQWRLKPILQDSYLGKGDKLSPPNPQYPHEIEQLLLDAGFVISQHTGIRVFHDYLNASVKQNTNMDELFELEAKYCRMPVYRDMGRYVHIVAKKSRG